MSKRWEHLLYILVFFGAVAALAIGGAVRPDRASSSLEHRRLAQIPPMRWSDLVSGEYGRRMESYLSDQFLGRDRWVRQYSNLSLRLLGKRAMNGVVVGDGGVLLGDLSSRSQLTEPEIEAELDATMAQFTELDRRVRSYGGRLLVVGHPTKNSFMRDSYPAGFAYPDDLTRIAPRYFAALNESGIASVDMTPILEKRRDEKLFYLTDHHWTFRGAYPTYATIVERLGLVPLGEDDLEMVTLPNRFVGSFNRKLATVFPQDEKVTIASPREPIPYTRIQDGEVSPDLFRRYSKDAPVAYGIYDQGDHAEIIVDTDRPELPTLLLVGDSFTNAIETLVWTNFDESRFLDLRHYTKGSLYEYVEKHKPDDVVILVRDERYLYRYGNGAFSGSVSGGEPDE